MTEINGWTCEVLADGTRQARGPMDADDDDRAPCAWLRPDGSLEALSGSVMPPAVVRWLVAEVKR
jgi:hypothetical protein